MLRITIPVYWNDATFLKPTFYIFLRKSNIPNLFTANYFSKIRFQKLVNKIMHLNNTFPQWSLRDLNTVTSKWLQKICSMWRNFMIVTLQSWASLTVPYHIWERWPPYIKNLGSISSVPYENRNSSLSPNRNTFLRLVIQYHVTK